MRAALSALPLLMAGMLFVGCAEDQSGLIEAQSKLIKKLEDRVAALEDRKPTTASKSETVGARSEFDESRFRSQMRQEVAEMIRDNNASIPPVAAAKPATTEDISAALPPPAALQAEVDRALSSRFSELYQAEREAEAKRQQEERRKQMRDGTERFLDGRLNRVAEQINLSDVDKAKIKEIALSSFDLTIALNDKLSAREEAGEEISREERQREMEMIRNQRDASLKVALTPEQYEAVAPLLDMRRGFGMAGGDFGGNDGGGNNRRFGGNEGSGNTPRARGGNRGGNPSGGTPSSGDS